MKLLVKNVGEMTEASNFAGIISSLTDLNLVLISIQCIQATKANGKGSYCALGLGALSAQGASTLTGEQQCS